MAMARLAVWVNYMIFGFSLCLCVSVVKALYD